jgi:hypothetical protein
MWGGFEIIFAQIDKIAILSVCAKLAGGIIES